MNHFQRQEILVKRLLFTQQHNQQQQWQMYQTSLDKHSRKRRQLSPDRVSSSSGSGCIASRASSTENEIEIINTNEAWHEVSSLLPMLSYGDESNALLSALLGLPASDKNNDDAIIAKNEKNYCRTCNKEENDATSQQQRIFKQQEMIEKLLSNTLEHILQMKNNDIHNEISHSNKKQPREKKLKQQQEEKTTNNSIGRKNPPSSSKLIPLPWNSLLRISIRLSSHAARVIVASTTTDTCYCTCRRHSKSSEKRKNEADDEKSQEIKSTMVLMHPILQVLDIILSEMQVFLRTSNFSSSTSSAPVMKKGHDDKKGENEPRKSNVILPHDRFLYDWKSNCTTTRGIPTTTTTSSRWGPSRYEFIKDVDSITVMLRLMTETKSKTMTGISITEWQERINSIIDLLDEQFDVCDDDDNQWQKQGQKQYCSPLKTKLTTLEESPVSSSPLLASITRDHVKRILHSAEADVAVDKCRKRFLHGDKQKERQSQPQLSSFLRKNFQPVFKSETSNDSMMIIEGETNELEDAYRMAIAFSSLNVNEDDVRGTIERRLSILVHVLMNDNNHNKFQLDGTEAYLKSLLNTLIQPSELSVWDKLLNDSQGKESPIMLRRGRAVLVSFLVGLRSPGWKDCRNQLRISPVPSHLGFLSHEEDPSSSSEVMLRSSFLLPSLNKDTLALPPVPIVTEVGLSVCIRNALEGNDEAGITSVFHNSARFNGNDVMNSIVLPLPNVMELTRDLFDLILRLAAEDDSQHQKKSFPLCLVTPLPAESLEIVLQVASDFSDWLCPHSVSDRYRFILEQICQSFQSVDLGDSRKEDVDNDDTNKSWYSRASSLLRLVESPHIRARISLYVTQFIIILCGKGGKHQKVSRSTSKQPHFYALLQQRQFSNFWDDIDDAAHGITSGNFIDRVFDLTLCIEYIMPLALQCSMFLTERSKWSSVRNQVGQDELSLVIILGSVLSVLAEEDLLYECTHVGWTVELMSFSFSYFLFGEDQAMKRNRHADYRPQVLGSTCMWELAAAQMDKVYRTVWGRSQKKINCDEQWQTLDTAKSYIAYENIGSNQVDGRMILIPSFNVLVSALIKYACSIKSLDDDVAETWCKFVSNVVLDRYIQALASAPGVGRNKPDDTSDKTIRSLWIRYMASTLQEMILGQTTVTVNERSTEQILKDCITPLLRRLHISVMKRALRYGILGTGKEKEQPDHRLPPDLVATTFTDLFKQESDHFLTKPSPSKTRKWDVYRKCIERIFLLTPPSTFFAHPSHPGLSAYSSDALSELWTIYGQRSLTQATLIMVAAGLHVNASATHLMPNQKGNMQDKELLKQRYNSFSACVKQCIISSFGCLNIKAKKSSEEDSVNFDLLARSVRRDLSFNGKAGIGLTWWNEITQDLYALREESSAEQIVQCKSSNRPGSRQRDIAAVFSTLKHNLSAISKSK